jgi:hypothetical protein
MRTSRSSTARRDCERSDDRAELSPRSLRPAASRPGALTGRDRGRAGLLRPGRHDPSLPALDGQVPEPLPPAAGLTRAHDPRYAAPSARNASLWTRSSRMNVGRHVAMRSGAAPHCRSSTQRNQP